MIIERRGSTLVVRDRPGAFWLLGGMLLTGGVLVLATALGFVRGSDPLAPAVRLSIAIAGVGVLAAASWWLKRSPGSIAEVNLARRELSIARTGLGTREVRKILLADVQAFAVTRSKDDEGGEVVRPVVRLHSSEEIALSVLWSHDPVGVSAAVSHLEQFCALDSAGPDSIGHT